MLSPDLPQAERIGAMDAAKVYWQMSRNHADTLTHAEIAKPTRFTGQRKGKKAEREDFLRQVAEEIGSTKRQAVCLAAINKPGFSKLFGGHGAAYRACTPQIFDRIRKRS